MSEAVLHYTQFICADPSLLALMKKKKKKFFLGCSYVIYKRR